MPRPLLTIAVAYGLGCLLGDVGPQAALWLLALPAVVLALALHAPKRHARWALWAGALALGVAGASVSDVAYDRAPLARWAQAVAARQETWRLRGVAVAPVPADGERHPLVLDVQGLGLQEPLASVAGRVRLDPHALHPHAVRDGGLSGCAGVRAAAAGGAG